MMGSQNTWRKKIIILNIHLNVENTDKTINRAWLLDIDAPQRRITGVSDSEVLDQVPSGSSLSPTRSDAVPQLAQYLVSTISG